MLSTLKEWDRELFILLNNIGEESWDSFWIFCTQEEHWLALFIYFFILIYYFNKGKRGIFLCVALMVSFFVTMTFTGLAKEFFERLRPNNVKKLTDIIRVLQEPSSYSFFSGHASSSFSIVTFVVLVLKQHTKWIYLAYVWPVLFALSRIYVGVHYPSDILVGAAVGIIIAFMIYHSARYLINKYKLYL